MAIVDLDSKMTPSDIRGSRKPKEGVRYFYRRSGQDPDSYGSVVFSLDSQISGLQSKLGILGYGQLLDEGRTSFQKDKDTSIEIILVDDEPDFP